MGNCSSSDAVTPVNDVAVETAPAEQVPSAKPEPLSAFPDHEEQRTIITSGNTLRASRQGESLSNPSAFVDSNNRDQQREGSKRNAAVVANPLAGQALSRLSVTNLALNCSTNKPRNSSEERQRVWVLRPSLVNDSDDADEVPITDRGALTATNLLNMRLKQKAEARKSGDGSSRRIHQWLAENAKSYSGFRPVSLDDSRGNQDVVVNK